jgi:hypothetical protein
VRCSIVPDVDERGIRFAATEIWEGSFLEGLAMSACEHKHAVRGRQCTPTRSGCGVFHRLSSSSVGAMVLIRQRGRVGKFLLGMYLG